MSIGFTEILLIVVVILILFGARRIPEIAKALGRASHEFKKAKEDIKKESQEFLEAVEERASSEDKKQEKKDDPAAK
ncbi:MAG: twin-arginine translocase TatA/TatE family subunit [Endomicrobium sp.]|jgi:sec-independent protein translocase protein TatA|nr:twin-arginine translocase TatA/TatE family subunit [Endomicrobium sp.]